MMRIQRQVCVAVLTAVLFLFSASPVRADWDDWSSNGETDDSAGIALAVMVGATHFVYSTADIVFIARGRWLTPGWAWTQTIWGGVNITASLVMVPLGALGKNRSWLGLGIGSGVLGTWFAVHGIISLVKHYKRRLSSPPRRTEPPIILVPDQEEDEDQNQESEPGPAPDDSSPPGSPSRYQPAKPPPPPPPPPPPYSYHSKSRQWPRLSIGPTIGGFYGVMHWEF